MKLGELTVKRRYSLIQIIVDIFSAAVFLYICFIVYSCEQTIEQIKALNHTQADLSFLNWQPLLVWPILGALVSAASVAALIKPRKAPRRFTVNKNTAPKFCNAVDMCVSCVRLILLHALSEGCYLHMRAVLRDEPEFSVQLIIDAVIIILLLWVTNIRLQGLSEAAEKEEEEKPKRTIIED